MGTLAGSRSASFARDAATRHQGLTSVPSSSPWTFEQNFSESGTRHSPLQTLSSGTQRPAPRQSCRRASRHISFGRWPSVKPARRRNRAQLGKPHVEQETVQKKHILQFSRTRVHVEKRAPSSFPAYLLAGTQPDAALRCAERVFAAPTKNTFSCVKITSKCTILTTKRKWRSCSEVPFGPSGRKESSQSPCRGPPFLRFRRTAAITTVLYHTIPWLEY